MFIRGCGIRRTGSDSNTSPATRRLGILASSRNGGETSCATRFNTSAASGWGSVGFPETGREAKKVEDTLLDAYRGQRALVGAELMRLNAALGVLAAVAQKELGCVAAATSPANLG